MDEKTRHRNALWVGIGLAIASIAFPYLVKDMPTYIAWLMMVVAVCCIAYGVFPYFASINLSSRVPLQEAARLAFEQTRGSAQANFSEGFHESPQSIQLFYARSLLSHPIQVYGKRLPSTKIELIKIDPTSLIEGGKAAATESGTVTHIDLEISKSDLRKAIGLMRRSAEFMGRP